MGARSSSLILSSLWLALVGDCFAQASRAQPGRAPAPAAAAGQPADSLARAAELIDAGKPTEAIVLLDERLRRAEEPRALLLRSTARFLLGELEPGEKDLRRALELDPSQRQGWLNLAALELASVHYDAAYQAFLRAETLDPKAPDNDVNLGAALLYLGRLEEASARFERYLGAQPTSGEAYYLVATNYAAAGYAALALRHLTDAIHRDEKTRLRARTDPNFSQIATTPEYQRLLATDLFVAAPGRSRRGKCWRLPTRTPTPGWSTPSSTRSARCACRSIGASRSRRSGRWCGPTSASRSSGRAPTRAWSRCRRRPRPSRRRRSKSGSTRCSGVRAPCS